ncbi:MAG TPA: glycerophosphodiester phosphodiesterase family protein [Alphaproteobacteria bacterium]|nr:glycerophosphodiester phosphodiesterase family protein [Alphaproteobacteria bacterium]
MTMPAFALPKVIGHRGAALRAPENTLAGFTKAAALGVTWVEFDVRLSLEGRAVVFHDDTLERLSDGSGKVGATPLDDLLARDVGARFDPAYKGERIPTLEETLLHLRKLRLAFNLEMKAEGGREEALSEATARALEAVWPREAPVPLLSSFQTEALAAFARRAPSIPRGYLVEALGRNWRDDALRLGASAVVCNHRRLAQADARAVKAAGYWLATYTVNRPDRAEQLFAWGVDAVISDAPDAIVGILR